MVTKEIDKNAEPLAYSVADVSIKTGLSERTVHRLVANGSLASVKTGRRRLILRESLRQLLTGQAA